MKVLLFSNDIMPFGELPTSGGGLRCWQLKCGLEAHGIEVLSSMPGFTYLAQRYRDAIPEEQRELLWRWDTQDEILAGVKPDAVIFASNWDHFALCRPIDIPLIVDLHGSRLIETAMWNTPASPDHKVSVLAKADCLLTAGMRQRDYFYGWLVQAGRFPDKEHFIRYIPVSLSPRCPARAAAPDGDPLSPRFVSGGGWFPWQNQSKAIFAACEAVERAGRGSVEIFGTPHEIQGGGPEELSIREVYEKVERMASASERVRVRGYVGRNELLDIYSRASVALEVMRYNLERELAFTTRTIEYLWCGLPVMYNDFGEISGHVRDYDAGWAIDPEDESRIKAAIDEILENPGLVERKSQNARRLVKDRFSWDRTIEPLVDFLQSPVKAKAICPPCFGPIPSASSYLNPRGTEELIGLSPGETIEQPFIVPAENVSSVELGFAIGNGKTPSGFAGFVEISLTRDSDGCGRKRSSKALFGEKVSSLRVSVKALSDRPRVRIPLPLWRRPRGGEKLLLRVRSCYGNGTHRGTASDASGVSLIGLRKEVFPLLEARVDATSGGSLRRRDSAPVVLLCFETGTGRVYRLKGLSRRAWSMLLDGEWRRICRAVLKRLPRVFRRVL